MSIRTEISFYLEKSNLFFNAGRTDLCKKASAVNLRYIVGIFYGNTTYHDDQHDKHMSEYIEDTQDD